MLILTIDAIYIIETISTGCLVYDLTNLTLDPHYIACFAGIVILIGGELGTLSSVFGSQDETHMTEVAFPDASCVCISYMDPVGKKEINTILFRLGMHNLNARLSNDLTRT